METKSVRLDIKSIDASGTFEGYAATWDLDLGGDIIRQGAFSKSLNDNGGDVPIFWNHTELIGRNMAARQDAKGLWVRGQINLDVQRGREAYALAKQGAVKCLSIGYQTIPDKTETDAAGNRILKELKWFEYSLAPIPMNPAAAITNVKAAAEHDEVVTALRGAARDLKEFYRKMVE
jgi:HK97 family phage prohead protease